LSQEPHRQSPPQSQALRLISHKTHQSPPKSHLCFVSVSLVFDCLKYRAVYLMTRQHLDDRSSGMPQNHTPLLTLFLTDGWEQALGSGLL
jgi:hypothetical protein